MRRIHFRRELFYCGVRKLLTLDMRDVAVAGIFHPLADIGGVGRAVRLGESRHWCQTAGKQ
jgi:hypothetical protein